MRSPEGVILACDEFDFYRQEGEPLQASISDEESDTTFEDFIDPALAITPLSGSIDGLRFWGEQLEPQLATCDEPEATPFTINFYADAAGAPGTLIAQLPAAVATVTAAPAPSLFRFDLSFAPLDVTGASWISIVRQTGTPGCRFWWTGETDDALYDNLSYLGAVPQTRDKLFCLRSPALPSIVEIPAIGPLGAVALALALAGLAMRRIVARRHPGS
ncbi:MAG: hypothetical protein ABI639_02965 [Thermoanaerobaculia bacterium]